MVYYPNSICNTFQYSWDEINNQIVNKCLEGGFHLIFDLIALLLKISIMSGIDPYRVIAMIAIKFITHCVNIQLFMMHIVHVLG